MFLKTNCYLKSEAGEERSLDTAITGWKGDGCGAPKTTRAPSRLEAALKRRKQQQEQQHGLLDNTGLFEDNPRMGHVETILFPGCKFEDTALLGADLPRESGGDGVTVRSFVECRQRCRDQRGCQAFTFVDEWELNCFLKADKGEESDFEGAVSGTLEPCSAALANRK